MLVKPIMTQYNNKQDVGFKAQIKISLNEIPEKELALVVDDFKTKLGDGFIKNGMFVGYINKITGSNDKGPIRSIIIAMGDAFKYAKTNKAESKQIAEFREQAETILKKYKISDISERIKAANGRTSGIIQRNSNGTLNIFDLKKTNIVDDPYYAIHFFAEKDGQFVNQYNKIETPNAIMALRDYKARVNHDFKSNLGLFA